jgi:putative ABC transport system permease protein
MVDTLFKDIRYSLRTMLKRPGFMMLAVVTLALGIGANTAIFSVLYAVLLRPLPYPNAERIVRIDETEGKGGMGVSPPNFVDIQQQNHSLESIAAYSTDTVVLTGNGEPQRLASAAVTHDLFSVLQAKPILGRSLTSDDERAGQNHVALVSHGLWQRQFGGDASLAGRQITLDSESYTVIGIMPAEFEFPIQTARVDVWLPLTLPADMTQMRGAHFLDAVGRLKPNVSVAEAHADLDLIATRIAQQFPTMVSGKTTVVPLKKDLTGEVQPYLLMLAIAVSLVLLIATANVASLMLARAAERQKEIALRLALGASRLSLLRQLLVESLMLSLFGGSGGVLVAVWATDLLTGIGPADLPRLQGAHFNLPVLLFALGASLFSGLLFGLAPISRFSFTDLQAKLKEGEGRSSIAPRQSLRKVLVIGEITLSVVLLCGAGLLIRTLSKLNEVKPGFDPDQVMVGEVMLPQTRYQSSASQAEFFAKLLEQINSLPNVESAAGTTNLPLSGTNMVFLASVEGSTNKFPASFRSVTASYFSTMRVPLLKGRLLDASDVTGRGSVVVINETLARQIAGSLDDAIGKRIKHGFKNEIAEVVGVVGDVKFEGLDKQSRAEMYAPFAQRPWPFIRLVVRTKSDPLELGATIRREVQVIDKDQPLDKISTMRDVVNASIAARRFYMQLLGSFAGLAFLLASIGIYGVVSYSVTQRTRELGIRMALGAKRADVLRLVVSEGLKLTAAGVILGLLGAFAATRVLRTLLFEVKPTDPVTFVAFPLLLGIVALVASYIPARRATRLDPLVVLRDE